LTVIKEACDNEATPYYAMIICVWGTLFLELWKRKTSTLAYEWDVDEFEATEPDRPEFYGTKAREVTLLVRLLRSTREEGVTFVQYLLHDNETQ
ncbi:hypothetical protein AM593_00704, partial [Mytilus galloprovincialis]